MPRFNADAPSLFDPIEIVIEGKIYKVKKVTPKTMKTIAKLFKRAEVADKDNLELVFSLSAKQLHLYLGVPESEFDDVGLRKLSAAIRFITETVTSQSQGKDEEAKKPETGAKK